MATVTLTSVDASSSLDFALPFPDINYLNFFNKAECLTRNLAPGKFSSTIVGLPTQGAGYAEFTTRKNFLRTTATQGASGTIVVCARTVGMTSDSITHSKFFSNYSGGSLISGGTGLHTKNTSDMSGLITLDNLGAYQTDWCDIKNADHSSWNIWALRYTAGTSRLDNLTTGVYVINSFTNQIFVSTNRFCVGGDQITGSTNFNGRCDIASACHATRYITDSELSAIRNSMRTAANMSEIAV